MMATVRVGPVPFRFRFHLEPDSNIINGTPVLLHFIFGTPVFFRLLIVAPALHANYNRDIIQVFAIILPLNSFKNQPWSVVIYFLLKRFNGKITANT